MAAPTIAKGKNKSKSKLTPEVKRGLDTVLGGARGVDDDAMRTDEVARQEESLNTQAQRVWSSIDVKPITGAGEMSQAPILKVEEPSSAATDVLQPTTIASQSGIDLTSEANGGLQLPDSLGSNDSKSPEIIMGGLPGPPGDDDEEEEDDDDDAGLYTPEQNNTDSGRSNDGVVVGWGKQGYSKRVVIRYGPKNSPKYTRSASSKTGPFDETNTLQFGPDHRYGDEKVDKKYVRQWSEFQGMLGVAYDCQLEKLEPRTKGDKRRYPRVDLWVKWSINGVIHRVWEVPSSIKHLWPNLAQCEEYIYNAAVGHAQKHQQWIDKTRIGRDASPTPAPILRTLMPQGLTTQPNSKGKDDTPSVKIPMKQWKEKYLDEKMLEEKDMTDQEKTDMRAAWATYNKA